MSIPKYLNKVHKELDGAKCTIRGLYTKSHRYSKFECIPTIEEMVDLCLQLDLKMLIDVKQYSKIELVTNSSQRN